MSFVKLDHHNG